MPIFKKTVLIAVQPLKRYETCTMWFYTNHSSLILNKIIQKYETFWRMIFLVVTIASGVLINKVYQYQTNPHFDQYRRGDFFNLAIYGLLIAVVHTVNRNQYVDFRPFNSLCLRLTLLKIFYYFVKLYWSISKKKEIIYVG
jgi:hypothetical protein